VGRADPARGAELPGLWRAAAPGPDPVAGLDQALRRGGQQGPGRAAAGPGQRDPRRRRGDRRRPAPGPVPHRRVPDRVRHLEQHERERGDRHSRGPRARPPGAPQRPRQRLAELQRRVPVGDRPGRLLAAGAAAAARARRARADPGGQGRRVRGLRPERAHAPHGRGPCHPGTGVRRVRRGHPQGPRPRHGGPAAGRRAPAGRDRRRHRAERPGRVRRGGDLPARLRHRPAADRGRRSLRGGRVQGRGCRSTRSATTCG
jgi:hypothetical protein